MRKVLLLAVAAAVVYYGGGNHAVTSALHAAHVPYVAAGGNEGLANRMAAARGWGPAQQNCLDDLWDHESGFRADAQNPSSTAYGIPQFLDATWGAYGPKTSDPALQIKYGLEYIHDRYGTPCAAWNFEMSHTPNWY